MTAMWHQIDLTCWPSDSGVATIDNFASEKNRKTMRFNSKHLFPGTLGLENLPSVGQESLAGLCLQFI